MSETARMMLIHGVAAARDSDYTTARRYLERVLTIDATHDQKQQAHLWLSRVASDPSERRAHLEEVLALNPTHGEARREIAVLDGRLSPDEIVDPDRLPKSAPEPEAAPLSVEARRFICPQCAGRMRYEPGASRIECLYCGHRIPLLAAMQGAAVLEESDFVVTLATAKGHAVPNGTRAFRCQGCQATLITAAEISTHCPYCGSSHIVGVASEATILPEGIIPFNIDAEDAQVTLLAWFKEHLQGRRARTTRARGVFLPVWTFDLIGEIAWRGIESDRGSSLGGLSIGESGIHVKRGSSTLAQALLAGSPLGGGLTSQSRVHEGSDYVMINDEIVPATHKVPYALHQLFEGYDWSQVVPYAPSYLSDWPAELYKITVSDASLVARRRVLDRSKAKIKIRAEIQAGDLEDLKVFSRDLSVDSYKLVLVPVWIANYRLGATAGPDDVIYTVVVNGQTGATVGQELPGPVKRFFSNLLGA